MVEQPRIQGNEGMPFLDALSRVNHRVQQFVVQVPQRAPAVVRL